MARYISEFIGTGILFCSVVGSGIMGQTFNPENEQVTLLANTLSTVFALYFLISSFQSFSTHFNPAVSFIFCLKGDMSVKTFAGFAILQIAGAIAGVMLANYMFGIDAVNFSEKDRSGTNLFVSEAFASFGLLLVILLSTKENVASAVAAYIGAAYWFTSSTSFANPAGTIGRAFSNSFAGINPKDVVSFCIAQLIGAFLAYLLHRKVFSKS